MRDSPRLFTQAALAPETMIDSSPGQAHYLASVLRRGPGDTLRLFNGRDGEYLARIESLRRDRASFRVAERLRPQDPEPDLWLLFALLKRDATDLVVQKATELGASRLAPVLTERSVATRVNPDRLAAIAIEAAEQSERLTFPAIDAPLRLAAWLGDWPHGRSLVAAIERADAPPIRQQAGALLIGPEGGFSAVELDALRAHPLVVPASLGPRILRAETAAIAGLALLQEFAR